MQVIIPASGLGSRFSKADFPISKPFIEVGKQMMLERVIDVFPKHYEKTIVLTKHQVNKNRTAINKLEKIASISVINDVTDGPLRTVVNGCQHLLSSDQPIMIANSDMIVNFDFEDFHEKLMLNDGLIVTFNETNRDLNHWSFIEEKNGTIVRILEKERISDLASLGVYAFKSGQRFLDSSLRTFSEGCKYKDEWYVSCVYQDFLRTALVRSYLTEKKAHSSLGTPYELYSFMQSTILDHEQSREFV